MRKPTSKSVTDIPCSCGYLAESASDPNLSVIFKPELNEYHMEHTLPSGAKMYTILYHCPFCGGVASESRRDMLFAVVTEEEMERLRSLIRNLKTIEDIERALGAPDDDCRHPSPPPEVSRYILQPRTGKPETGPFRVLTYTQLSQTAKVQFIVFSDGEVQAGISPQYVGPTGSWDS